MARPRKLIDPREPILLEAFGRELLTEVKAYARRSPTDKHSAGSLRWLEVRAKATPGWPLPPTTVWRIFNGSSAEPEWLLVERVLTVAGVPNKTIANKWRPMWVTLMKRIHELERPVISTLPPAATLPECPICGAGMANRQRHLDYHVNPVIAGVARAS